MTTDTAVKPHPDCKAEHEDPFHDCTQECEADHCDDGKCAPLGSHLEVKTEIRWQIQEIYARLAPAHERNCDWWRSMEEPWASLRTLIAR